MRATLLIPFLLFALLARAQPAHEYALRGTVVTPAGLLDDGVVVVLNDRISEVGDFAHTKLSGNVTVIDTKAVIAPGFIDLHNHLTWNVFPRWHPAEEFGSRYDWQQKPVYQTLVESPHRALVAEGFECLMERFAEVRALSQGETSVTGSLNAPCSAGLARNLDVEKSWGVVYDVFPFEASDAELTQVRAGLASGATKALLIHVAEGSPRDASSAREFAMLKARGLLAPGVSLIHGVALSPSDFVEMAAPGVGLVWSPRSNLELYGDTARVAAAKSAGVRIALAPDWGPSGSDGVLDELNYAAAWNEAQQQRVFTDEELVRMVTAVPAALVGATGELGVLSPGSRADLVVIRPDPSMKNKDAWWTLTHASASQVRLVVVNGEPVYGEPTLLGGKQGEPLEVCGEPKRIVLRGAAGNADAANPSWDQTVIALSAALAHHGRKLAPLAECGQ